MPDFIFNHVMAQCSVDVSDRVFRGQFTSVTQTTRPKYKKWDTYRMSKAVEAVLSGKSIRRAALDFNVPKSTLSDRISGRVQEGVMSGPHKYLSDEEELELEKFLILCGSMGYPKTRYEVLSLVQRKLDLLLAKGWIDMELFSNWFHSHFLRYVPTARPLLLLMDGHSSHYCPDTIRMAAQEKIIIFA